MTTHFSSAKNQNIEKLKNILNLRGIPNLLRFGMLCLRRDKSIKFHLMFMLLAYLKESA